MRSLCRAAAAGVFAGLGKAAAAGILVAVFVAAPAPAQATEATVGPLASRDDAEVRDDASASPGDVPAARQPDRWDHVPVDLTDHFTTDEMASWRSFANRHRAFSFGRLLLSIGLYAAFAFTGLGRRTFRLADRIACGIGRRLQGPLAERLSLALGRIFGPRWGAGLLFTWIFLAAVFIALLPFQLAAELDLRAAGLSVYSTSAWLWDWTKGQLLTVASFTCIALGLFGLIRRIPRWWWLILGLPAAGFLVAWGVASPYQARVFYEFAPLEDAALEARLEALAARGGITLTDVKVIDASRHTTGLNAYVTGLGPSRELVLFDTLLDALEPDEIEAVVAHELGHVERERPLVRYGLGALTLLGLLWLMSRVLNAAVPRMGLDGPGDARALPLLLLVVTVCFFLVNPASRAMSRHEERLADRAGLVLTGNPDAFIRVQVALARHNRADVDPAPWVRLWFSTHPSIAERIGTAKWYAAWMAADGTDEKTRRPVQDRTAGAE